MAAQKLTKARFVQIIIMLTVLIFAFFWRTYTHQPEQSVECNLSQKCTFQWNKVDFHVVFNANDLEIRSKTTNWSINTNSNTLNVKEINSGFSVSISEVTLKSLRLVDTNQDMMKIIFK